MEAEMQVSRRAAIATLAAAALGGSAVSAITASGHDRRDNGRHDNGRHEGERHDALLLRSALAPSVPTDPAIHGVTPGAAPWVLRRGDVSLRRDGRLDLRVRGLVIPTAPANGTPGPVSTVTAAVFCGNDPTAAAVSPAAPISRAGDARIRAKLTLPAKCLGAVVLVQPNASPALYIAANGFGG
jgi:hypothetical protein